MCGPIRTGFPSRRLPGRFWLPSGSRLPPMKAHVARRRSRHIAPRGCRPAARSSRWSRGLSSLRRWKLTPRSLSELRDSIESAADGAGRERSIDWGAQPAQPPPALSAPRPRECSQPGRPAECQTRRESACRVQVLRPRRAVELDIPADAHIRGAEFRSTVSRRSRFAPPRPRAPAALRV